MSNNKIDEEEEYPRGRHRPINSIGVFKVMEGEVAVKTEPKPTEMIIETILPYGFSSIIAGTTGCNKSYFAMQMGMSIANDENEFLRPRNRNMPVRKAWPSDAFPGINSGGVPNSRVGIRPIKV